MNRAAFLISFFHQVGKAEEMYSHPLGKQEVLTVVSLLTGKIGSLPATPKLLPDAAKLGLSWPDPGLSPLSTLYYIL